MVHLSVSSNFLLRWDMFPNSLSPLYRSLSHLVLFLRFVFYHHHQQQHKGKIGMRKVFPFLLDAHTQAER